MPIWRIEQVGIGNEQRPALANAAIGENASAPQFCTPPLSHLAFHQPFTRRLRPYRHPVNLAQGNACSSVIGRTSSKPQCENNGDSIEVNNGRRLSPSGYRLPHCNAGSASINNRPPARTHASSFTSSAGPSARGWASNSSETEPCRTRQNHRRAEHHMLLSTAHKAGCGLASARQDPPRSRPRSIAAAMSSSDPSWAAWPLRLRPQIAHRRQQAIPAPAPTSKPTHRRLRIAASISNFNEHHPRFIAARRLRDLADILRRCRKRLSQALVIFRDRGDAKFGQWFVGHVSLSVVPYRH